MTSTVPSLFFRSALVAAAVLSMGASCEIVVSQEDAGAGDKADHEGPAYATAGCDPSEIVSQNGGACASCEANDGSDARICGDADTADCINQENAYGERCQFCATQNGEVLFDDCTVSPDDVGAARCEVSPGDPSQGTDDASECSVCFDERGSVVSSSCEPVSDECHEVDEGGRLCRECTSGGVVVVYQCDSVDVDPAFCEAYQNDVGRCVDCYAEAGALLTHQCQLFEDEPIVSCFETIDPSGLSCVQCFDQAGNLLESGCNTTVPEARACQLLRYTSQTCVVCVDDFGEPVLTDCTSTTCEDPASSECAPPPECWFEWDGNQALCRTCFMGADAQETETQCLTDANLVCSGVPYGDLPPDPNEPSGEPAPPPPNEPYQECLVCKDGASGVEVYRNCGNNGATQPPVCVDEVDELGNLCSWCYDAYSGETLYSSCAGGDTCYVTGERALTSPDGAGITNENGQAVATCYRCGAEGQDATLTESDFAALCALPQECVGPDGFVDPDNVCATLVSYVVAPRQCDNGWDVYGAQQGSEEELLAVLGWSLTEYAVSLAGVAVLGGTLESNGCNDSCGACARGDLFEVSFEDVDLGIVREAFASQLLQCQSELECPAASACLDGFCGYY